MSDIPAFWRRRTLLSRLLWPLSIIMAGIVFLRRRYYTLFSTQESSPEQVVVVIGNLSVGGNGKTPVVIALTKALREQGVRVGVVSRGYGGSATDPQEVLTDSQVSVVGDEALVIKQQCEVPVFIDKKRQRAVQTLMANYPQTQVIISDDGLQHYAMARTLEWVVIARDMGLGNGWLLPAGPLREGVARLHSVDKILVHGSGEFSLAELIDENKVVQLRQVNQGFRLLTAPYEDYQPIQAYNAFKQFNAITAIARPERFFQTLTSLGILLDAKKALPDHAKIAADAVDFAEQSYVIITEKDAIKTKAWPLSLKQRTLVLAHELMLPMPLVQTVIAHLAGEKN